MAKAKQKPPGDFMAALQATVEQKSRRCMVCDLPYVQEINEAIRVGKVTGRWRMAEVFREMKKRGFAGSYERLRAHCNEHLGGK